MNAAVRRTAAVVALVLAVMGVLSVAPARADTRNLCVQANFAWVVVVAADGSLSQACSGLAGHTANQHLTGAGFSAQFDSGRVSTINDAPAVVNPDKQWRVYSTTHYSKPEWQPYALEAEPDSRQWSNVVLVWVYVDRSLSEAEGRPSVPLPPDQPKVAGDLDYNGQADIFIGAYVTVGPDTLRVLRYVTVHADTISAQQRTFNDEDNRSPWAMFPSLWGAPDPDLLSRDEAGGLWLYQGFSGVPQQVGRGWGAIQRIVALPDIDGDGRAELLAQSHDGRLLRYRFDAQRRLSLVGTIGQNWGNIRLMTSVGDFSGDGVPDLLAVTYQGDLLRYNFTRTGTITSAARVGVKWQPIKSISVRGDLTNDGRADLLAWTTEGELRVYPVAGPGRWGTTRVLRGTLSRYDTEGLIP